VSAKETGKPPRGHLTVEDLEAALRLLSAEEEVGDADWRKLLFNFLASMLIGLLFFALPTGLITVWFRFLWGLGLLGVAVAAYCLLTLTDSFLQKKGTFSTTDLMRARIKESELDEASHAGWARRDKGSYDETLVPLAALIFVLGLVGLSYGLYGSHGKIIWSSLILCISSILAFITAFTLSEYREYQYLFRVSKLLRRFQEMSRTVRSEEAGVKLSPKDEELLAQIETKQINRTIANALAELTQKPATLYSVVIEPQPLEYLGKLPENERNSLRNIVDSLQTIPRHEQARPFPPRGTEDSASNKFVIASGKHAIIYMVNGSRQRVDVIEIRYMPHGEVTNAS
jgi:mRNA-degrading endonuclease RelE of RelBE toxin-antitoxin system